MGRLSCGVAAGHALTVDAALVALKDGGSAVDAAIAGLRSDIAGAANLPFVFGQIGTFLSPASFPTRDAVNAAIADTPNRVANTAVASSAGLSAIADGVHYDAASVRTMGGRLFAAWDSL